MPAATKDSMRIVLSDAEADMERKPLRCVYHFIHDAGSDLQTEEGEGWVWYHKVFYDWLEQTVALGETDTFTAGSKL